MKAKKDLEQLLAAAQRHHADERRQQHLADLVDQWAAIDAPQLHKVAPVHRYRRRLWYGVAASMVLLVAAATALSRLNDDTESVLIAENIFLQSSRKSQPEVVVPNSDNQMLSVEQCHNRPVTEPPFAPSTEPESMAALADTIIPIITVEPLEYVALQEPMPVMDTDCGHRPVDNVSQKPTVKERTSTRMVISNSETVSDMEQEPQQPMLAFKPVGSTEMRVDIFSFNL